jgi:hypothetical protein
MDSRSLLAAKLGAEGEGCSEARSLVVPNTGEGKDTMLRGPPPPGLVSAAAAQAHGRISSRNSQNRSTQQ